MGFKRKMFSFECMSISVGGYVLVPSEEGLRIDIWRGHLFCCVLQGAGWLRLPAAGGQALFKWEDRDTFSHLPEEYGRLKYSETFYGVDGSVTGHPKQKRSYRIMSIRIVR